MTQLPYLVDDILNRALIGRAGKTSLASALRYTAGASDRLTKVNEGSLDHSAITQ
jgi:hypothetical protein